MKHEYKIALEHAGTLDPVSIDDYIAHNGFIALKIALQKEPLDIIHEVTEAGLRGRGGAGFSTGKKKQFTGEAICRSCGPKYIVCNADEGEPGTFKDRIIMEQVPFRFIEGMIISAYSIGAKNGYIYIRGEYHDSIKKVQNAIEHCYKKGFLGKNILDSQYSLDLEIKLGAGSYLCGEELTLLESLEGKRGYPRIKPPFPAEKGLWGRPTLVNNVETFAHLPFILNKGAGEYKKLGTKDSPGTKIFTISGDVNNPGAYETQMGITLRQLIEDLCGGMKNGKPFKAAIIGGAAGTFVDESLLDTPMGYDSLKEKGAILGSGAVMVLHEDRALSEMLVSIMDFFKHESCGKCVPCRVGTAQLVLRASQLANSQKGQKSAILDDMLYEAQYIAKNSLCPLGQSPVIPIKSMVRFLKNKIE